MYHPVISTLAAGRPSPTPPRFDSWDKTPPVQSRGQGVLFPGAEQVHKTSYTGIMPSKKALHPMGRPPVITSVLVFIQFGDRSRNLLVLWSYKALPGFFGGVASVATQGCFYFFFGGARAGHWRAGRWWAGRWRAKPWLTGRWLVRWLGAGWALAGTVNTTGTCAK